VKREDVKREDVKREDVKREDVKREDVKREDVKRQRNDAGIVHAFTSSLQTFPTRYYRITLIAD